MGPRLIGGGRHGGSAIVATRSDHAIGAEAKRCACMASLLFAQNCSAAIRTVPQEDVASFLSKKLRSLLNADDVWMQKAPMLFLLAVNYKI